MQCSSRPAGVWHEVGEEVDEVLRPGGVGDPGGDTAVVDVQAGEEHGGAVAPVLELPAAGQPLSSLGGRQCRLSWVDTALGLDAALFVHHHTMAFSGGFKYRPHTSAAFSQNAGSWLVIHDSHCQGLRSRSLQMRHTCDAEIATPSSFRRRAMAS